MTLRRSAILIAAGLGLIAATPMNHGAAKADLWSNFYQTDPRAAPAPEQRAQPSGAVADEAICLAEIMDAQLRYGIPNNLLLAIGIQEAGRRGQNGLTVWPWSINAGGEGIFFDDRETMLEWVENKLASGATNVDLGCMQINQRWHGAKFTSLDVAIEPRANVDYAARYLLGLYQSEGDWWRAAGRYHSATSHYQEIYLGKLARNQQVANANIENFVARIQLAGVSLARQAANSAKTAAADPLPAPAVYWSSDLSNTVAAAATDRFSIYSAQPLRPLLPTYREMN